jgi:hypothetical protein
MPAPSVRAMQASRAFVALACGLALGCPPAEVQPLDLSERLASGQARAGMVTDEAALVGGISAEGQLGDIKIYNDRVQFVIQAPRTGSYLIQQGGGVIDADLVRPVGVVGRDMVDDWTTAIGLGRLMQAEQVVVLDSGTISGRAVVAVQGHESPLELLTGALEAPELITDLGIAVQTVYTLEADSWLLEVKTTLTATQGEVTQMPGDALMGAVEVADRYAPGIGFSSSDGENRGWTALLGCRNEGLLAIVADAGQSVQSGGVEALTEATDVLIVFGDTLQIPAGESRSYTRYYALTPDPATLTDAIADLNGTQTELLEGVVTAPDGPVHGARVHIYVDEEPYSMAFTGEDGSFAAQVPTGVDVRTLASGRGPGRFVDAPQGAGNYAPYAASWLKEQALASIENGAVALPMAEGRAVATEEAPLVLQQPGWLIINSGDGLPFQAQVGLTQSDPSVDSRVVQGRPLGGKAAMVWSRDGEVQVTLEPGTYNVLSHRGPRYELDQQTVEVIAGQETILDVALPLAFEAAGWLLGDPHSHASPSGDGGIPMEDRLLTMASAGVQLHFGTDHDHIADYRPLLQPLGLSEVLMSVVADEVSPVMRGHLNIYPVVPEPSLANNGAWMWWTEPVPDTSTQMGILRQQHGDEMIIQSNHPLSGGLLVSAGWSEGVIGKPDFWSEDFQAIEVLNKMGQTTDVYWDLILRGQDVAAVGVSDCHGYNSGGIGLSTTYFGMGVDDPTAYTDAALIEAVRSHRTIASRGVFLDMSIEPGSLITSSGTLEVTAKSASWVVIDTLRLLRDGEIVQEVSGTWASFELQATQDAAFVVEAVGASALAPYSGMTPWAFSSAILLDVDGDGWDAPLPPLQLGL